MRVGVDGRPATLSAVDYLLESATVRTDDDLLNRRPVPASPSGAWNLSRPAPGRARRIRVDITGK